MKAMILAAGLGTRLRPLTDDRPKALVTVAGRTLLEIAISRLRSIGVREVIVNAHHYADMISEYLKANHNFGIRIEVSREDELLDTGGGLKKAAWFFQESGNGVAANEPFLVHNVDVISNIDLASMLRFHNDHTALATLAVQQRETSRYLLFNKEGQLCGRRKSHPSPTESDAPQPHLASGSPEALAFSGIHIISPRIFPKLTEQGAFSIIDAYLRLAAEGEKILCFHADGSYWRDLGRPDSIAHAALDIASGNLPNASDSG